MPSELSSIYSQDLTTKGIEDLRDLYPKSLVMDMSNDDEFKKARKIRTERNKLVESINRRRIDTMNEVKSIGENLIHTIDEIYSVVIDPFEHEDSKRKDEAKRIKEIENKKVKDSRDKINSLSIFLDEARRSNSGEISSMIAAVTNIECSSFHKELIHEAVEKKEAVLSGLTEMLTSKLDFERIEREKEDLEKQIAILESSQPDETPALEPKPIISPDESETSTICMKVKCRSEKLEDILKHIETDPLLSNFMETLWVEKESE